MNLISLSYQRKSKCCVTQKRNKYDYWSCTSCFEYKNGKCKGYFKGYIKKKDQKEFNKIYFKRTLEIMKEKGYIEKKELKKIAEEQYKIKITDDLLDHYCKLGLLKGGKQQIDGKKQRYIEGIKGSVSFWEENDLKILYVIRALKESGFKIKLEGFKYWLELLNLSENAVNEIKKIYEEYKKHLKEIFQNYGITPKKRTDLLRSYDMRVLNYEVLITRFDILKRIFLERACTELDWKEITEIYLKHLNTKDVDTDWTDDLEIVMDTTNNPVDNALSYPDFNMDLDIPEIKVIYKDPINKIVVFKKDKIEVLN